ncbi:hypothetical protein C8R46DRAFT_1350814 [Mycena filopes]|nr:hypothetical protein C8R46DRAFT_1350814 [Mycena filopes]
MPSPPRSHISSQRHPGGDTANSLFLRRESSRDALIDPVGLSGDVPRRSRLMRSSTLQLFSLVLHSAFVALHVSLIIVWHTEVEHRLVFSLNNQKIISFLVTAITTTFGTIYSALLVFVTQTLWMRRSLQVEQTLTATHDHAAAWTGIGSAMLHIWRQKTVAASWTGTLAVFLYLGNILALHISTPALFSIETFNFTQPLPLTTQGLPTYDFSTERGEAVFQLADTYTAGSLYYLASVLQGNGQTLGLNGSTLYDVVNLNSGLGNVTVNATGFNITCLYTDDTNAVLYNATSDKWIKEEGNAHSVPDSHYEFPSTQSGVISSLSGLDFFSPNPEFNRVLFYSTVPVVDSNGNQPHVNLNPPMSSTYAPVPDIQIFRCSQTLVNQTAVVDAQSRMLLSVKPDIHKETSTWLSHEGPGAVDFNGTLSGNDFIDLWQTWYNTIPQSTFPRDYNNTIDFISLADLYIIQKLNFRGENLTDLDNSNYKTVFLHELENALGEVVAAMFWTLANIQPTAGNVLDSTNLGPAYVPPSTAGPTFLAGNATAIQIQARGRLDLSIIAIVGGLVASVALTLLSLPSSIVFHKRVEAQEDYIPVDGTGLLHVIWLYRNHPEIEAQLEQVEHPTDENLRRAGMIPVKWKGGGVLRRRKSCESF